MGNGEQYIWKPPEDDDIITLHPPPHRIENGQGHPSPPSAKEVVHLYVCVCGWEERGTIQQGTRRLTSRQIDGQLPDL